MTERGTLPPFLVVGRVLAPWGVKGEVKVESFTDSPTLFTQLRTLYIGESPFSVERSRIHKRSILLKLANIDTWQAAEGLRGQWLEVPSSEAPPLPEDHYYHFQVLGLQVWTTQGEFLGRIVEILATRSNDVYRVETAKGEILIPAIEDVVQSIDLAEGRMVVEVLEGMLD